MKSDGENMDPLLVNAVARSFWVASYKDQNPEATTEDVQNEWKEIAPEYRKIARIALRRLASQGISFVSEDVSDNSDA